MRRNELFKKVGRGGFLAGGQKARVSQKEKVNKGYPFLNKG